MSKNRIGIKIPNNNALPRCHWNKQHGRKRRAKRAFETPEEAITYIRERNLVNKYNYYKCRVCSKYHIGHKI